MRPVLNSFCDGYVQHAFTLCTEDPVAQRRLVAYAISRGKRRVAGRLAERFGLHAGADGEPPPGWSSEDFLAECAACVREAEDAEERELRAANARRVAADDDAGCLQLPPEVAQEVHLVSTAEELRAAAELFARAVGSKATTNGNSGTCGAAGDLLAPGRALGLDVEWRPALEKRSGMQKHRRSSQATRLEPCATLQVAADRFVVIFDLLALAPEEAATAPALSELLASLFGDAAIAKLGFGLRNDVQRLAASYPHIEGFRNVRSAVDVQEAWADLAAANGGGGSAGLSALCARHFGAPLSKRLQTSDWGARPLAREQVLYAALDAHCLIGLARALPAVAPLVHDLEVRCSVSGQLLVHKVRSSGGDRPPEEIAAEEELAAVDTRIAAKGAEVRAMKAAGAAKAAVQAEVAVLLQLKARFRELSGAEWVPSAAAA